jgi:hypothetical protein
MKSWLTLLSMASLAFFGAALAPAQTPNTPLQHVIVIFQENRTPDNLFLADAARLPGAHLVSSGSCHGTNIALTPFQLDACFDPSHGHNAAWLPMYHNGQMDGACDIPTKINQNCSVPACSDTNYAHCLQYTYVPNTKFDGTHGILDPYFQLAEQYGFANWMFQTNQGPSFPAHQFIFTGTSEPIAPPTKYFKWFAAENAKFPVGSTDKHNGCIADQGTVVKEVNPNTGGEANGYTPPDPPGANAGFPCYEHNTMKEVLEAAGISWRYYGNSEGSLWMAPNAIDHICKPSGFGPSGACTGADFSNGNVVSTASQILTDLGVNGTGTQNCQLQQVSWVIPDGNWSDHPGTIGHDAGPSWVAAIVNAVGGYDNSGNKLPVQCNYWGNTAILVTWDDWGGFFDDVNPISTMGAGYPNSGGNGSHYVYGFRVPLLVVSPFAKQGYISGPASNPTCPNYYCHDFGSILNFIEYAFGKNGQSIGTVGPGNWPYADFFAQDRSPAPNNYSLYDFFNFSQARAFTFVQGAKYGDSCFLNPRSCFAKYPEPADSE